MNVEASLKEILKTHPRARAQSVLKGYLHYLLETGAYQSWDMEYPDPKTEQVKIRLEGARGSVVTYELSMPRE